MPVGSAPRTVARRTHRPEPAAPNTVGGGHENVTGHATTPSNPRRMTPIT
jgi:hypothetical protein